MCTYDSAKLSCLLIIGILNIAILILVIKITYPHISIPT